MLSTRGDFLGNLSVFDNRVPDLFNNYYRLKHVTKAQAIEIIRRTAGEADLEGPRLVDELAWRVRTGIVVAGAISGVANDLEIIDFCR